MKQAITIIVVFLLGIGVGIGVDKFVLSDSGEKYTAVTIEESIKEISDLSVLELDYTEQENWDGGSKKFLGKNVPFTAKSMQLIFSGKVKAGPNLENMKVEAEGNNISVTLPHSEILSHEIDENSIQLLSVKDGVFNRVTPDNNNEVRKQAKEAKEKKILESDFLEQADEKAVAQIEGFLKTAYPDAKVSVAFEEKAGE